MVYQGITKVKWDEVRTLKKKNEKKSVNMYKSSTNMINLHLSRLNVVVSVALELGACCRRLCRKQLQPCLYGFISQAYEHDWKSDRGTTS